MSLADYGLDQHWKYELQPDEKMDATLPWSESKGGNIVDRVGSTWYNHIIDQLTNEQKVIYWLKLSHMMIGVNIVL